MSQSSKASDVLGPVLRDLRIERGLTQAELATRAGLSKSMLSLYERGKQRPHLDTLERILDALGTRLSEFVARLDSWSGDQEPAPARRGPRRNSAAGPVVHGTLEEEAVLAATRVLQGIAALLRQALQGDRKPADPLSGRDSDSQDGEH